MSGLHRKVSLFSLKRTGASPVPRGSRISAATAEQRKALGVPSAAREANVWNSWSSTGMSIPIEIKRLLQLIESRDYRSLEGEPLNQSDLYRSTMRAAG